MTPRGLRARAALMVLAGFSVSPALGQTWVQQSPWPTNQHIYDLSFTTPSRGFVVGTWRALVETRDGGLTWTKRMGGGLASDPFYRITFFDDDRGFVFGNNNDAWRTVNGGTTWTQMPGVPAGSWYFADFVSPTVGVAGCNGAGASTSDGGLTWNILQGWPESPFYAALDMRDASVGLCAGSTSFMSGVSGVQRTTDGGRHWTLVREGPAGEVMWLDSTTALAFFSDGFTGTLVERSTDAGLTWQSWGSCPGDLLDKVARVEGDTLVGVVHAVGTVYRSTDGGKSWSLVLPGVGVGGLPNFAPWSFSFPDPDHGYLGGPNGMLFASTDRGATWAQISRGIGSTINGLDMVSDSLGFAVADYHTLRTTDGGDHWNIVHLPRVTGPVFGRDERATCIHAVDRDFIVVAGLGGIVFRSVDGGDSWESVGWPAGLHDIYSASDVHFTDHLNGWVVGVGDQYGLLPSVYRTTDGGWTWFEGSPATLPRALYSAIDFADPQRGWIAVSSNIVYRTVDGGETWARSVIAADFLRITDVKFASDGRTGYLTGFYGEVYRTTDGGVTWRVIFSDPEYSERALGLSVLGPDAVYITVADGSQQFVRYSLDAGAHWSTSAYPPAWSAAYLQPEQIEVRPSGRAFASGYWGIIATAVLPAPPPACPADLTGDGVVDFTDYLEFLNLFDAGDAAADLNDDGVVDFGDYLEFLNYYDVGC